jgi:hypothetical protein
VAPSSNNGEHRHQIGVRQLCGADRCIVYHTVDTEYISAEHTTFIANPAFCFAVVGVAFIGLSTVVYSMLSSEQRLELNRVHRGTS